MIPTFAELLTPDQVLQVHEASLQILEDVGMLVRNAEARQRFARHGCGVDEESLIVRFPRSVIEHFLAACPPSFTFHGRDPRYDRTIPADGPLMIPASATPDVVDLETGRVRRARSDDVARLACLVNQLPGYDLCGTSVTADDAPPGQANLSRIYPALKNSVKPIRSSAPGVDEMKDILDLCAIVAGSTDAFWERPFITVQYCPVVSPLTLDVESTEKLMRFTEWGVPSFGIPAPNAGVTSPLTLLGTVAQCNAEFLAQTALEQMSRPGKPTVYDTLPTVADLRAGAYAPGGIESGILVMGLVQMARFYHVPSSGFAGLTNAKVNDAQSGFETGMSTVAALLGGADLLTFGGVLDGLMTFDLAKAVIDNEIALMLKRIARGLEFSAENLALPTIAEVGPGGSFIDSRHTLKRVRSTAFLPEIADREAREQWEAKGALDSQARAMRRVRDILSRDNPAVFSPDLDARIRARFSGLVAGDIRTGLSRP
jgi:trimethylamine--corrinoid protein Co-methyltransferase